MTEAYVDDLIRTFVALPVSSELVEAVRRIQKRARIDLPRGLRWTSPEQAHMTLAFLGDIGPDQVNALSGIVTEVASQFPPFESQVQGIGGFPRPDRPRVVWAGVDETSSPRFRVLHETLWERIEPICPKPKPNDRPFRPHITLARVSGPQPPKIAAWMVRHADWIFGPWLVGEICLIRSVLTPSGPVYEKLVRSELTGSSS